jgi:eukaryotic-like serine/threonine-protein kinase
MSKDMRHDPVYSRGQRIGDYRLLRQLGRGGFADVYLAEPLYDDGQWVAIKLLTHLIGNTDGLHAFTTFIQEARMIQLSHPHIVPVQDFGISREGIPFLVMEYASGGTLRQRHPKGTQVPLPTVIGYIRPLVAALQYLHEHRLVHCDVKPENMLLGADGRLLISDFSIVTAAHTTRSLLLDEQLGGSLPYMAPERFHGQSLRESDQYSLGVVVYEWLCGHRPYEGFAACARLQGRQTPPSLCAQLPSLDRTVEQAVFRALDDDPSMRFGTVREFAAALEEAARPTLRVAANQRASVEALVSATGGNGTRQAASSLPVTQPSGALPQSSGGTGISRRAVIRGLALSAITLAGGSMAWVLTSQEQTPRPVPTPTPGHAPRPTAKPIEMGRVLIVYRKHAALVNAVSWSPDGQRLASGADDATVQVWDSSTGRSVLTYRRHKQLVEAVAWSPDGQRIASGGFDNTVQVWHAAGGTPILTYHGHTNYVMTVAWSPDSARIASGSYDTTIQVWDAADGGHVLTYRGHSSLVHTLAWSPGGKYLASASFDHTVQVWDAADGTPVLTYWGHAPFAANALSWSPDGQRIASGGNDQTVQIWGSVDGHLAYTYGGHTSVVDVVSWSPDGLRIASGGDDTTVQVWHAADGGERFIYRKHTQEVRAVAWSPDSRRIASGGADRTVQVWGAG